MTRHVGVTERKNVCNFRQSKYDDTTFTRDDGSSERLACTGRG
jgi:hypothetical protein